MQDFIFQEVLKEFEVLPSTQTKAKEEIENGSVGSAFCVTAKIQTNGRGRMERKWESSEEGNIYMTIALEEKLAPTNLSLYVPFVVLDAINSELIKYKWPNDLLIENQKFAGILIEKYKGFFLIGIGVNVKSAPLKTLFPATFLEKYGLFITAKKIFESFQSNINKSEDFIINTLSGKFFSKGEISINKGEFKGVFKQIKQNGNLVLTLKDGSLKEVTFGDVSF